MKKPDKELVDVHRSFFRAIISKDDDEYKLLDRLLKELAKAFESDEKVAKKLPGVLLDIYFQTRVSLSFLTHAKVLDSFKSSVELSRKKTQKASYARSLVKLASDVVKSSPKRSLLEKLPKDHVSETERILMTFQRHLNTPMRQEDRAFVEGHDYMFVVKLRLLSRLINDKKFEYAVTVLSNLLHSSGNNSTLKTILTTSLMHSGDDTSYSGVTLEMLGVAKPATCPCFESLFDDIDAHLFKRIKISPGKLNAILWTMYHVVKNNKKKNSTNNLKNSAEEDERIHKLYRIHFPELSTTKKQEIDDVMSYMFEPVYY